MPSSCQWLTTTCLVYWCSTCQWLTITCYWCSTCPQDLRDKEYNIKRPGGGYWELGRLGPDLETEELQAKREKAERMRDMAAQVGGCRVSGVVQCNVL